MSRIVNKTVLGVAASLIGLGLGILMSIAWAPFPVIENIDGNMCSVRWSNHGDGQAYLVSCSSAPTFALQQAIFHGVILIASGIIFFNAYEFLKKQKGTRATTSKSQQKKRTTKQSVRRPTKLPVRTPNQGSRHKIQSSKDASGKENEEIEELTQLFLSLNNKNVIRSTKTKKQIFDFEQQ